MLEAEAGRGADGHLGAGLGGQLAGAGDEVVVDVGVEDVGDGDAVLFGGVAVAVYVAQGVDEKRGAGGVRADEVGRVAQAFVNEGFDEEVVGGHRGIIREIAGDGRRTKDEGRRTKNSTTRNTRGTKGEGGVWARGGNALDRDRTGNVVGAAWWVQGGRGYNPLPRRSEG